MEILTALGRTMGFSFAAGLNLYATVALLGLASRYQWVDLPPQYRVFGNPWIIGAALILYVVEFIADKVPWVDTAWDAVHTVVRPLGGAAIAIATLGHASPATQAAVALLGAGLATSTHVSKAAARAVANTSPEPFSNWLLSLTEDGVVVALGALALTHPLAASIVVLAALAVIVVFAGFIVRAMRRRFRRA